MGIGAHGGFAEYVRISEKSAYKIANDLPHEIAVFAEPLACVVNGTQKIKGQPGESALIIGAGPIGLLFLLMLKAAGMSPIVVSELSRLRRDLAARCGADRVVNPREEDLLAVVNETTGIGMDVAIDVVGTQIGAAIGSIRKGGRVLAFGVNAKAEEQINQSQITFKEATVCGTWLANATFPRAVRILESGVLDLKPLITHTLPLTKIHEGIELLARGEGVEILVVP
jgi:threonine dehydrogenase-like Zn-dependent dehydrogenase